MTNAAWCWLSSLLLRSLALGSLLWPPSPSSVQAPPVLGLGGRREQKEKAVSYDSEEGRSSGVQSFPEFYDLFLAFVVQPEVNGFL